jgi:hypothetical protein
MPIPVEMLVHHVKEEAGLPYTLERLDAMKTRTMFGTGLFLSTAT